MATVLTVNDAGRLTNTSGTASESHARVSKFARRILGDGTLDYGWNGGKTLTVSAGGDRGDRITLNAKNVVIPQDIEINGTKLQDIIDSCTDLSIQGIVGVDHEIVTTLTRNTSPGQPRLTCRIGISPEVIDRITGLEQAMADLMYFDEIYHVGDGLIVVREESNRLSVQLGDGLKFKANQDETTSVTLDVDAVPTENSTKAMTSGGIYNAIAGIGYEGYHIAVDPATGNMVIQRKDD